MITIIDAGIGNLGSVGNMIRKVGGTSRMATDAEGIAAAEKLILPGVGAFGHGMERLRAAGMADAIIERARAGTPLLGICLGMQLLAKDSEEDAVPGLGLIDAHIRRFSFPPDRPMAIPHVGWNEVVVARPNPLIVGGDELPRFYFTHSFHAYCERQDDELATATYGYPFTAAFGRDNVYGVQFHPEKSHKYGMELIRRFLQL